jgi:pimeloyl-ACP methyl ester carboxylesterase
MIVTDCGRRIMIFIAVCLTAGATALHASASPPPGWYMRPGGEVVLVSPGPEGGHRRLDFRNAEFAPMPVGTAEDEFRWVSAEQGGPALISPEGERWVPWPDAPYTLEDVRFTSRDGTTIGALVLLPRKPASRGAVIIHGSGDSDRDNVWAYTFAHALAEAGAAVLFPDKRGSGASGGDWREVGFDALAQDAAAAFDLLARRTGLAPGSIGWVGLSQGGWVAPLAARIDGRGGFIVSISSAAVPVFDQIAFEVENTMREEGFGPQAITDALTLQQIVQAYAMGNADWTQYAAIRSSILTGDAAPFAKAMPADSTDVRWSWWARVGQFDPLESWARAGLRTLVIYGADDQSDNVPVDTSVHRLRELARRPIPGLEISTLVFPGIGHTLIDSETEWVSAVVLRQLVDFVFAGGV